MRSGARNSLLLVTPAKAVVYSRHSSFIVAAARRSGEGRRSPSFTPAMLNASRDFEDFGFRILGILVSDFEDFGDFGWRSTRKVM